MSLKDSSANVSTPVPEIMRQNKWYVQIHNTNINCSVVIASNILYCILEVIGHMDYLVV